MWFYYYSSAEQTESCQKYVLFRFQCGSIITDEIKLTVPALTPLDSNVVLLLHQCRFYRHVQQIFFRFQCGSIITVHALQLFQADIFFRFQCGSIITTLARQAGNNVPVFRFQCGSIITV